MPTRREHRPIELMCQECGFEFVASVPHLVHYAEDSSQPDQWTAERVALTCPSCGSWRVGEQNA